MKLQSVKDCTLFTALRQSWTVPICQTSPPIIIALKLKLKYYKKWKRKQKLENIHNRNTELKIVIKT